MKKSIVECSPKANGSDGGPSLYDREGNRKYLTVSERAAFLEHTAHLSDAARLFCIVLAYTGARISEVLALTPGQFDLTGGLLIVENLKKRRRSTFRAVPMPRDLLTTIDQYFGVAAAQSDPVKSHQKIWAIGRTTAWKWVRACMALAGITGARATPKGLRHTFAVASLQAGVPINLVKKWLGHSRLATTEIYANAVGDEELQIAQRHWDTF